jgi:hypothetical protein
VAAFSGIHWENFFEIQFSEQAEILEQPEEIPDRENSVDEVIRRRKPPRQAVSCGLQSHV